ncbi:thiamine phosphate synthase [Sulfurospirillum multivorans]|uniref:Thiamine monophosphate synthase n=2 Tax=Sulfurospirillum multivorans TaxID=66821 RepID=A0AA86ANF8_SULMK|nr:thiamine phosphate synthase [Sulfurospirillum multivorans]AHJ12658.1 putative thiamine monophosphate synthase [Sulfurospirillum multivorans DSM 12446]QEH06153.1 putative thiamine monophosphate synthase [Sulfurospirillum multivorans]
MIKRYLITDPSFYTSNPAEVVQKLLHVKAKYQPDYICLRDKQTSAYTSLAKMVAKASLQDERTKLYLHTDFKLAYDLGCDGVHLPSNALHVIENAKALGLEVIVSTHALKEIEEAEKRGADAITFSPIFATPNKGEPLGLEKLKEINDRIRVKCFALGGIINADQVKACEEVGVYGFASIRFFLD